MSKNPACHESKKFVAACSDKFYQLISISIFIFSSDLLPTVFFIDNFDIGLAPVSNDAIASVGEGGGEVASVRQKTSLQQLQRPLHPRLTCGWDRLMLVLFRTPGSIVSNISFGGGPLKDF